MAKKSTPAKKSAEAGIGMSSTHRKEVSALLNVLLSDEFVLYVKTKKFHWNIQGIRFHDLHQFFEKQYRELDEIIDSIAERVRKLDYFPVATMQQFLNETQMAEHTGDSTDDKEMIGALLADHETLIRQIRQLINTTDEQYNDAGTADFLTQLLSRHETMAWMLRALVRN